jgi:hypothetical protein
VKTEQHENVTHTHTYIHAYIHTEMPADPFEVIGEDRATLKRRDTLDSLASPAHTPMAGMVHVDDLDLFRPCAYIQTHMCACVHIYIYIYIYIYLYIHIYV